MGREIYDIINDMAEVLNASHDFEIFNTFIQQSLNVEGIPFIVTKNSKEALREQAVAMLMLDLRRAEERAEIEGWIDADDLERELGVID